VPALHSETSWNITEALWTVTAVSLRAELL